MEQSIYEEAKSLFEYSRSLRRDFHINPELGFREFRTAGIVSRELSKLGLEITTGVAETGVVALLEGGKPGPVILVRVDMDALPVKEETGAEYASQVPGVMHACGHDGHVAVGLTVAKLLEKHRQELNGTVKLVFQPAEEGLGGALRMVQEGVLENPKPDMCLALHLWNDLPLGRAGITPGPLMAGAAFFDIKITGQGGHGASPQQTIDPVVAAAQVIMGLQTIVSRNVSPLQSAVISVTRVRAGEAYNVIPSSAELCGTLRFFEPEVKQKVVERFEQVVKGTAVAFGCQAEVSIHDYALAVINEAGLAHRIAEVAKNIVPGLDVTTNFRLMVSEDMSEMMNVIPGLYMMVGSANSEMGLSYGHHHPKFDFDERALINASALMTGAVLELLSVKP